MANDLRLENATVSRMPCRVNAGDRGGVHVREVLPGHAAQAEGALAYAGPRAVWGQDPIDPAYRHGHLDVVARLMVLVRPPRQLKLDEAEDWLRQQLAPVVRAAGVRSVALSRLASASMRWSQDWGWLIEFDFDTAERARGAVRDEAWAMLLGDLRLLGMSPTVALVDGAEELRP